jgi:hypothetical protein
MDEETLNHIAERLGDKLSEGLSDIAYALSDKLGDIASKTTGRGQLIPAPGWRLVYCHFIDSGEVAFTEKPLIGWLVTGDKVEPIYWDSFCTPTRGRVRVFPGQELDAVDRGNNYASFALLNPSEELDEKMRKHLECMATRESGYPCWSKKYRLETSRQIGCVLGNSCQGLSEEELAGAHGVNEYVGHALGDMKKDGLIIENDEHRFSLTKKGLEWAAQETVVAA